MKRRSRVQPRKRPRNKTSSVRDTIAMTKGWLAWNSTSFGGMNRYMALYFTKMNVAQ